MKIKKICIFHKATFIQLNVIPFTLRGLCSWLHHSAGAPYCRRGDGWGAMWVGGDLFCFKLAAQCQSLIKLKIESPATEILKAENHR